MTEQEFEYMVATTCPDEHCYTHYTEYQDTCRVAPTNCVDCWISSILAEGFGE